MARAAGGGGRSRAGGSLRRTFLGVALVIILPFAALVGYFGYSQMGHEKGRVQQEALSQARGIAAQVDSHLQSRLDGLATVADAMGQGGSSAEPLVRRLRQSFPDFEQVLVLDQLGAVTVAAGQIAEPRRSVYGEQEWFKRAATSTQPLIGEPRQLGPDVVVGFYAPARTADGQLRGVVAAELVLKRVQDLLARARVAPGAVVEVLSDRGVVVARQPPRFLMQDVQSLPGYGDLLQRQEANLELAFEDGERRLAGAVPLRPVPWTVAVGLPSAQVLADSQKLVAQVAGGGAAVAILALALAMWMGGKTARGVDNVRAALARLERGDVPTNVPVTVGGEVGALTESLNHVLGWLRNKFREIEALKQVEEAAGAAITAAGGEGAGGSGVLPELLRKMVSGMAADAGVLVVQEDEGLVTRAAVGFTGVATDGITLRRGQGLAGAVVGGRESVVVPDVEGDYRIEEPYLKAGGIHAVVAVPIVAGDRVLGAVEIGYRMPHEVTDGDIQRLEAMVRRTAQALEHERALEDVRRNTMGLEAKLAEQMEALQREAAQKAEAEKKAKEAQRQAHELQQTMRLQASQVREVVREKADPAAEEAKRVRAALQKTLSEELRVPLTALLDLPRFLVDGINKPLGHEEQTQLEVLHTRGEEILELIENLVTISALNGGQVKIAKAPFNMPELIQRVVRGLQPRAAAKGNRIQTDVKPDVGQVVSDAKRMEQILSNLILTSAKYTELGEIRVTCFLKGPEVVLTVADDGAGFSTEEQGRIFDPFLQVAPRDGRKFPGTGLLLTVCQRVVQLLGGKLKVESEVDRGTWFTITLPVQS
jgi:signal transduction histidine kinase